MTQDFEETLPVALCPQGRLVAVKSRLVDAFTLEVRDIHLGTSIATFRADENPVLVSWRPDGDAILFAMAETDGGFSPWLWSFRTSAAPKKIEIRSSNAASDFAWCPGSHVVAWRVGRHVMTFDARLSQPPLERVIGLAHPLSAYAWSPDGSTLAACSEIAPDTVTFWRREGTTRLRVPGARRVVDCAWIPDSSDLLVAVECDQSTSRIFRLRSSFELLHESEFQILKPFSFQGEPCWHEYSQGVRQPRGRLFRQDQWAPHEDVCVVGRAPKMLFAFVETPCAPRRIERLEAGRRHVVLSGTSGGKPSALAPTQIELATVNCFLWEPPNSTAACLWIEGGPGLCAPPTWNTCQQALLRLGIAILAPNYRGCSGFGVGFLDSGTLEERAEDILAARDFLVRRGYRKIIAHASSYGAVLACVAAASAGRQLPLVLSGLTPCEIQPLADAPPISAFHGARDPYQSPPDAIRRLRNIASGSSDIEWTVFPNEGHGFHRCTSLAAVHAAICRQ